MSMTSNNTELLLHIMQELKDIKNMMIKDSTKSMTIDDILNIVSKPYNGVDCSGRIQELYKNNDLLIDEKKSVELHNQAILHKHYTVIEMLYRLHKIYGCNKKLSLIEEIIINMDDSEMFIHLINTFNIKEFDKYINNVSKCDSIEIFKVLENTISAKDILYNHDNKSLMNCVIDNKCIRIMRHVLSNIHRYQQFLNSRTDLSCSCYDLIPKIKMHFFVNDPKMIKEEMIDDNFLTSLNKSYGNLFTIDKINNILSCVDFLDYDIKWKRFIKKLSITSK